MPVRRLQQAPARRSPNGLDTIWHDARTRRRVSLSFRSRSFGCLFFSFSLPKAQNDGEAVSHTTCGPRRPVGSCWQPRPPRRRLPLQWQWQQQQQPKANAPPSPVLCPRWPRRRQRRRVSGQRWRTRSSARAALLFPRGNHDHLPPTQPGVGGRVDHGLHE